jgi:hypothetical protein
MKCAEYGPWVSRYADDDLEGKELKDFLEHLSGCVECQREARALERLRSFLKTADAFQGMPPIKGDWGLADLLQTEAPSAATEGAEPFLLAAGREALEPGWAGPRRRGWIRRTLLPFPLPSQNMLRFALPLLVVTVVATWFYTRKTSNWIDVHELQPLPVASLAFPQEESREMDFFVLEHTAHQPWADHGDELPMIELASGSSR